MDWRAVAGAFIPIAILLAFGAGMGAASLLSWAKLRWIVAAATVCVLSVAAIPFLIGYVATGPCGLMGVCPK